jgi:tRNA (guanine37-N1)-methyltransferase
MLIDILSLFPEFFQGPFNVSIIKRATQKGLLDLRLHDIRTFASGRHKKVDDRPCGGGPGMVMLPGPIAEAIRSVRCADSHVIYLSPQGKKLDAAKCRELAKHSHLVLLCGHYEGVDERVIEKEIDEEISIGDYVLTSGCPAAVVLVDAVSRFIPGVIGNEFAASQDSFEEGIFDTPHYTGPDVFEGRDVPPILKTGHHANIANWRKEQAYKKTCTIRPDLIGELQNGDTTHDSV